MFLATYGVELFSFGLSIDEEAATYVTDNVQSALGQGRWGISLILLMTPSIGAIPMIATLLFGAGLLYATWRGFHDFALSRSQAFVFAVVHIGFPMWLHIVQFSTLAGSFGIGLAAAVTGAHWALQPSLGRRAAAALLIAFAMSVYQTLSLYCALYVVIGLHAAFVASGQRPVAFIRQRAVGAVATVLAAGVLYVVIQKIGLAALNVKIAYIDGFVQVDRLVREPVAAWKAILEYAGLLLGGKHPAYLGRGVAVLLLRWIGLAPVAPPDPRAEPPRLFVAWLAALLVTLVGVALLLVPTIMSVATLPLRAYVALPLLAAWLASRATFPAGSKAAYLQYVLLAYFALVSAAISSRLFYSDQVVHNADAALTQQLLPVIQRAAADAHIAGATPFSLVGSHRVNITGQLMRTEQFGASFYEQDGGNVYRVAYLMQLQGSDPLHPIWLSQRPDLVPAAKAMPIWPADGSVGVVNGVVLVKVGDPTYEQLAVH